MDLDEDEKQEELALIQWRRPRQYIDINDDKHSKQSSDVKIDVFVDGADPSDVVQGMMYDV